MMNAVETQKPRVRRSFKTVEIFEKWANEQEFSYEFVNKKIIQKEIKNWNLWMIWNLEDVDKTAKSLRHGNFIRNFGLKTQKNFRVPDLAYFTKEQHFSAIKGEHPIPELAIEFLSKSESAEDIEVKIEDYFSSGVKLVWYIYPKTEKIYAYTSPKNVQILQGDDICSAASVIQGFEFETKDIFKKDIGFR